MKKWLVSLLCASVGVASLGLALTNVSAGAEEGASVTTITMEMTDAAEIRANDPIGIRFQTTYTITPADDTVDVDAFLADYTFGTLVIPSDLLEGELTLETAKVVDIPQKVWATGSDDTTKIMNSVLAGIPDEADYYKRDLTARSYYTVGGVTTYAATSVKRNIAEVAAAALNDGKTGATYDKYVNAIATGVDIVEDGVDMVVGGVETITATTAPVGYSVVWSSDNSAVATVNKNGAITAKANGTANITATFGNYSDTITVTVADCVARDGSEIVYTVAESSVSNTTYAQVAEGTEIGGRTGVYQYTSTAVEWTEKLNVKEAGHSNADGSVGEAKKASFSQFKKKGYNYVAFDIYMTSGSYASIGAMLDREGDGEEYTTDAYASDKLTAGALTAEKNENITVYNSEGWIVGAVNANEWYTIVVDYSVITTAKYANQAGAYTRIEIGGINGTIYLDEVRYYGTDVWKDTIETKEYISSDGSEFENAKISSGTDAFGYTLVTDENDTYFGKYKFTGGSGWGDKISIKHARHIGANAAYSISTAAFNMASKGYNYVVFDYCLVSGGIAISSPEYTYAEDGTYTVAQPYKRILGTWGDGSSTRITRYEQGTNTLVTGYGTGWYTIVVAYQTNSNPGSAWHGIDISAIQDNTVAYIGNVSYYTTNPVV